MNMVDRIAQEYARKFGDTPELMVRSPGRINLIGEHTDYNEGFVLPAAIDKSIFLGLGPSRGKESVIFSVDMQESYAFDARQSLPRDQRGWVNYILGVTDQVKKRGKKVGNFNLVFGGDIPIGSGLSSSAALENAVCFALNEVFSAGFTRMEMIHMAQMAEHEYVGVKCGIMDQFASMMGKRDHVMLLDCRSLEHTYFPLELHGYSLLLINSNVHHNLAGSEYNIRRSQCEEGVKILQKYDPQISSLRDVSPELMDRHKNQLDEVIYRRCSYVVEENARVNAFCQALNEKDLLTAGKLLYRGHWGLSREYEVSCPETDFLVSQAEASGDVIGSRMMGGGFGGCTLNLVRKGSEQTFLEKITDAYRTAFAKELTPIFVRLEDGVSVVQKK